MSDRAEELRQQILELTAEYHAAKFPAGEFVPGESTVPVSGKVIDADDICSVVDSALDAGSPRDGLPRSLSASWRGLWACGRRRW